MTDATEPRTYFHRVGAHRFVPTDEAGGAWEVDDQHFSPLCGLIAHEMLRAREGRPALVMSRISVDILGRIARDEFDVEVRTPRPGRTIELMEATVTIAGRSVVSARAWFLSEQDTDSVAGGEPARLPAPESLASWPLSSVWAGGYIASLDTRPVGALAPGRSTAWVHSPVELVGGEPAGALASFLALVDTANGIAALQDPVKWMFPNVDLTVHLYRQPEGEWTGLDTTVTFGHNGQGLTSTVLHDTRGPVGRAEQILTVRPQQQL